MTNPAPLDLDRRAGVRGLPAPAGGIPRRRASAAPRRSPSVAISGHGRHRS